METVSASDARTHLSRLLREVAAGKTVTITKRGVPVARLTPIHPRDRPDRAAAVEAIRAFSEREKISLGDITIRELIEEGRL